jgi:hypothetical protein
LAAADPRFAQCWPHRHGSDAMFIALLRRRRRTGVICPQTNTIMGPRVSSGFRSLTFRISA